ncbi:MAG: 50S ribosomal protein L19e [Halobacteria archaeon]
MTDLKSQRRLAAKIMDCGENRVWMDPDSQGEIAEAITREDVRELVNQGAIREKRKKGVSRGRARERDEKRKYGHQKGLGTRKGKKGARSDPKDEWKSTIRALRKELRRMKEEDEIDASEYRDLYAKAKGGEFDSVRYLKNYAEGMEE